MLVLVTSLARAEAPGVTAGPSGLELTTDEDARVEAVAPGAAVDGGRLTFRLARRPAHGVATVEGSTGALSYVPAKDFHGDDAFSVERSDGRRATKAEVKVRVAPVNDAPVSRPVALSTREDLEVKGASSASDVDGDALAFRLHTPPAHGTATVEPRTGALVYRPAPDSSSVDTFLVEVSDGRAGSTFEVKVTVAAVNDAPVAKPASASLDEDGRLEGTLQASDVDGDALRFRVLKPAGHGEVQLGGPAGGAFTYVPQRDWHGADRFGFEVSDGRLKAEAVVELTVRPVNDAPVLRPLSLATGEDVAVTAPLVATDVDGQRPTFRVARAPAHGSAAIGPDGGAVTYQGAADFAGTDAFAVEASDGQLTALAEVSVSVAPVNDAPVLEAASFTLAEDSRLEAPVRARDIDGDALAFRLLTKARHGEVNVDAATGALRYVPQRDFSGDDGCAIEVSDGRLKASAAVKLVVTPVNDAPTAQPLALATREDVAVRGQLLARDVDGTISFKVSVPAAHGEAQVDPATGAVSFQPAPDFHGTDAFTIEVSDGSLSAKAEVRVVVSPVNDPPVLGPTAFALDEDGRLEASLVARDVDGDALTYRLAAFPAHGSASLESASGRLRYAPARDFFGDDAVTVEVSDGPLKATAVVSLKVRPVNDVPVVRPLALATLEDAEVRGKVTASDVDGALSYRLKAPPPHGEARIDGAGLVSYRPSADFNGKDAFTVEVSDGEATAAAEVTVVVAPVNDAPALPSATVTVDEDGRLELTLSRTDVDGDALTTRLLARATHGEATLEAATGKLVYVPARDFNGVEQLPVEASDGKLTTKAEVTVQVRPVNDAPVVGPLSLSTAEDVSARGALVASDVDRDVLRFRIATPPTHGLATLEAQSGAVTYAPTANTHGPDTFTVEVSDGALSASSLVSVAVAAVDDPPVVQLATLETPEDTPVDGRLPASEADGEKLTFRLRSAPRLGVVTLLDAATGACRFAPAVDLNGDDEVAFEVSDGKTTVPGALKLRVVAVNDAPVVAPLELTSTEDRPVEGRLVGRDVDGDAIRYAIASAPDGGRAVLVDPAGGLLRFEPRPDFQGVASFTVTGSDGKLVSAPAAVTVRVTGENDAPVAREARLTLKEDEVLSGDLVASDVDGDRLVFRVVSPPLHGSVKLVDEARGAFEYVPTPNFFGTDGFSFSAVDPSKASSTARVSLTITPVNDPPMAASETISAPFRGTITGRLKGYDRESRSVTFAIVRKPAHGSIRLTDARTGEFIFSTEGTSSANETVRFVVSDGELKSPVGELTIQIENM
jgi:VCBS repeat-containing protein